MPVKFGGASFATAPYSYALPLDRRPAQPLSGPIVLAPDLESQPPPDGLIEGVQPVVRRAHTAPAFRSSRRIQATVFRHPLALTEVEAVNTICVVSGWVSFRWPPGVFSTFQPSWRMARMRFWIDNSWSSRVKRLAGGPG
jgi:hypothetical protein